MAPGTALATTALFRFPAPEYRPTIRFFGRSALAPVSVPLIKPNTSWSGATLGAWSTAATSIHIRSQTAPANWTPPDAMTAGWPWLVMIWSHWTSVGDSLSPGMLLAPY